MDIQNNTGLDDTTASMREAIKAMAVLIAALQQREQNLEQRVQQQMQLLQGAVANADRQVNQVMEDALPRLTQVSQQALMQTLEPASERLNRTLADAAHTLQQATARYAQAQHALETTATRRMWLGLGAMMIGAILCMGGLVYAAKGAQPVLAEAAQRRTEIAYLDRVARADLLPCGKDRLCATFETKGPRYGNRGQYRAITLRQQSP
ncbi:hypothetical protein XcuCFBP2542_13840 [Xanthomonas cucurbitae]|uniref:Relaxation protein n=1 Tax=Xanthomonas cucurbitae TaxID=56453 RepID=A0A2S7DNT6_9XANT|nr:hypothetical protein [Xanthomonas cucurbitae]PPU75492.1 hypothetical protein XcuCFBP2542_13840 [Xanthomonas cucurbitae]WDM77700.1 hypothetical protein K6980_10640 [Xanthomonas cucurbitae]WDM81377.1 hypothetical protein K6979_10645 [Xanthomonas cucurbitae]